MDHLILPSSPLHPRIDVRLQDSLPYDGLDFSGYPGRMGWGEQTTEAWHQEFQTPSPGFASFLERWLLFGPVFSLFGSAVNPASLIVTRNNVTRPIFDINRLAKIYDTGHPSQLIRYKSKFVEVIGHLTDAAKLHAALLESADEENEEHGPIGSNKSLISLWDFLKLYGDSIRDLRDPDVSPCTSIILEVLHGFVFRSHVSRPLEGGTIPAPASTLTPQTA
ncbi:hypothetical protein F4861DRAFT_331037 [Xylaria intraflava]|nr:hypothetical protein F4861DRAFT_331037 [Xylaria intraflava]